MDSKISNLKDRVQELDIIDDTLGLEDEEIFYRKESLAELFRCLKQRNSLDAQRARIKWLKEGDINSKFFHRTINFRRKKNEITGFILNGKWTNNVAEVKEGVKNHFRNQFKRRSIWRPKLKN